MSGIGDISKTPGIIQGNAGNTGNNPQQISFTLFQLAFPGDGNNAKTLILEKKWVTNIWIKNRIGFFYFRTKIFAFNDQMLLFKTMTNFAHATFIFHFIDQLGYPIIL